MKPHQHKAKDKQARQLKRAAHAVVSGLRASAVVNGFALMLLAAGCASSPPDQTRDSNLAALSAPAAQRSRPLLHGGERGLEVRQWLITEDAHLIASTMARHGDASVLAETKRERLRRNGARLVRVPLDRLDALEADLGGATVHNVGWHGQMHQWQELFSRPLPERRAVAVDGRVRMFEGGRLRLMSRAWLVQTEDDHFLNVQIVPQHFRPPAMSYYALLGRDTGDAALMKSMAIDLLLEDGFAYVFTSESPVVDWEWIDDQEIVDDVAATRHTEPAGPSAQGPTTFGQLLLGTDRGLTAPPGRAMLILVPRVHSRPATDLGGMSRTPQTAGGARGS